MKNTKRIFVLCIMMIALSSCSNKNNESVSSNTSTPTDAVATDITADNTTEQPTAMPTGEPTATPKSTENVKQKNKYDDSLEGIEKYFSDKKLLSGKRTRKEASMIGGIDGFAYLDSDIEIYEYDINSQEYNMFKNGEAVPIKGMESFTIKADAINGKFILLSDNKKIIKAFNNFNK